MFNQELADRAHAHLQTINETLHNETMASIQATKIYGPDPIERNQQEVTKKKRVRLREVDSASCLTQQPCQGKVCILNYASYKEPGGMFLEGSTAQEEALCHVSNLFPVLSAFEQDYYEWNRQRLNRALYMDRALYTPNIVFGDVTADVLTCAAPNYRTARKYCNVTKEENDKVFAERIKFMFDVAEDNHVDTLIAGAWGCGVFMQDPWTTCNLLLRTWMEGLYNIPSIYFAIPNSNSRNFKEFERCLNGFRR